MWVRYQTILRITVFVSALWFSMAAVYIRVDVFVSLAFLCWSSYPTGIEGDSYERSGCSPGMPYRDW
ncbi:protein of unknown function [Alcaligenes faecalis subsp. faecalis]|nr:protein of unknown function [Alcaligenes faecalis subsp. faecalis]